MLEQKRLPRTNQNSSIVTRLLTADFSIYKCRFGYRAERIFRALLVGIYPKGKMKMGWLFEDNNAAIFNIGRFSWQHLVLVLCFAALTVPFILIFKNRSMRTKWIVLWVLTGIIIFYKCFNLIFWGLVNPANRAYLTGAGDTTQNIARWIYVVLPVSICSSNLFFLPIALKTKKPVWLQYVFTVAMLGATATFILLDGQPSRPWHWVEFFLSHWIYIIVPMLTVVYGIFKPKIRLAPRVLLLFFAILLGGFLLSAIMNYALNPEFNPNFIADYLAGKSVKGTFLFNAIWTFLPSGVPLLHQLFTFLPVPFVYLLLLFPLVLVLWACVLLPFNNRQQLKAIPSELKAEFISWGVFVKKCCVGIKNTTLKIFKKQPAVEGGAVADETSEYDTTTDQPQAVPDETDSQAD